MTFTGPDSRSASLQRSFGGRVSRFGAIAPRRSRTSPPQLLDRSWRTSTAHAVTAEDILAYLAASRRTRPSPRASRPICAARPARAADRRRRAVRRSRRARPRGDLAALPSASALPIPSRGRPRQPPRLPKDERAAHSRKAAQSPATPEPMPDTIDYDPATRRLMIGKGYVENVTPEMWAYEVSGKQVLRQWFSYRQPRPRAGRSSATAGRRRRSTTSSRITGCRNTPPS